MGSFRFKLTDSFSVAGNWWLPSSPEKRIPGTLTFEPGETSSLELHGAFEDEFNPFANTGKIHPSIVNGVSVDGVEFTLLSCLRSNSKWNLSYGYSQVWYNPRFIVSGACFASEAAIRPLDCELGLNFLDEWLGKIPFRESLTKLPTGKTGLNVTFDPEDFFKIVVPSIDAEIRATEFFSTGKASAGLRTLAYDRHTRLIITPSEKAGFEWFFDLVLGVRNLFFLLTGVAFDISSVNFRVDNPDVSSREFSEGESIRLSLFFIQRVVHDSSPVQLFDYPFSLRSLSAEDVAEVFEKWFEKRDRYETVLNLFFGSIRNENLNWQVKFLSLMQAIETFHRTSRSGFYLNADDYGEVLSTLIASIPSGLPSDLRQSLKSRMTYGNEYALRKRIKYLFDELGEGCRRLITEDVKAFIKKVVDTRNYLTHYSEELKDGALEGADLLNTCLRLRLLQHILLLKEIGFTEERILSGLEGKTHLTAFGYSEVAYSGTEASDQFEPPIVPPTVDSSSAIEDPSADAE